MAHPSPPAAQRRRNSQGAHITNFRRDVGCNRGLNWRCELAPEIDPGAFEARLIKAGYESRCRHPALKVLRHPEGHELAWVLRSGWVQIRVSLFVESAQRESVARSIYRELADLTKDSSQLRFARRQEEKAEQPSVIDGRAN